MNVIQLLIEAGWCSEIKPSLIRDIEAWFYHHCFSSVTVYHVPRLDDLFCSGKLCGSFMIHNDDKEVWYMVGRLNKKPVGINKNNAFENSYRYYVADKPCKYGHTGYRYLSTSRCVECEQLKYGKFKE